MSSSISRSQYHSTEPKQPDHIKTCWDHCTMCGDDLYSQRNKNPKRVLFALCQHPSNKDARVFETDVICRLAVLPRPAPTPPPVKPVGRGWDDY